VDSRNSLPDATTSGGIRRLDRRGIKLRVVLEKIKILHLKHSFWRLFDRDEGNLRLKASVIKDREGTAVQETVFPEKGLLSAPPTSRARTCSQLNTTIFEGYLDDFLDIEIDAAESEAENDGQPSRLPESVHGPGGGMDRASGSRPGVRSTRRISGPGALVSDRARVRQTT